MQSQHNAGTTTVKRQKRKLQKDGKNQNSEISVSTRNSQVNTTGEHRATLCQSKVYDEENILNQNNSIN